MKLSILTTCYNQRYEIEKLIQSILKQNIPFEYEILIGDDGSTDGSVEYLRELEERYPNLIKVYYNKPSKEKLLTIHSKAARASDNRYRLFKEMFKHKSEYFTLIDGDDYYTDEKCLEEGVKFLDINKDITGICYTHNVLIENEHQIILRTLEKNEYNKKHNIINNKYYQLKSWHHVASFIFRSEDKEKLINILGENHLVDDGNITLMMLDYRDKENKKSKIYYNKDKIIFNYIVHNKGIWTQSSEIEKMMLTTGSYSKKIFQHGGGQIALKAAENYKILNSKIDKVRELPQELINYYRELYKNYGDKILVDILDDKKGTINSLILTLKIKFLYKKLRITRRIYKKYYKIINMLHL